MWIFGIDIPLVELILALGIIGIIILIELIIILILISFHMRNSKRLESEIGRLSSTLMELQGRELKEIDKLQKLEETEKGLITRLRKIGGVPKKMVPVVKGLGPKERKKLYKEIVKKKKRNKLLEKIDKFLARWKK